MGLTRLACIESFERHLHRHEMRDHNIPNSAPLELQLLHTALRHKQFHFKIKPHPWRSPSSFACDCREYLEVVRGRVFKEKTWRDEDVS